MRRQQLPERTGTDVPAKMMLFLELPRKVNIILNTRGLFHDTYYGEELENQREHQNPIHTLSKPLLMYWFRDVSSRPDFTE